MTDPEDVVRRRFRCIGQGDLPVVGRARVDRVIDRYHRRRRAKAVWLGITAAVLLVVSLPAALGTTGPARKPAVGAFTADLSSSASEGVADLSATAHPTASEGPGVTPRSGPAQAGSGVTYPFDLYTHCGIRTVHFAGRDWAAVRAAGDPQRLASSAGITSYTGYVAGTMMLLGPARLRFTITDRYATGTGQAFDLVPAPGPPPLCG